MWPDSSCMNPVSKIGSSHWRCHVATGTSSEAWGGILESAGIKNRLLSDTAGDPALYVSLKPPAPGRLDARHPGISPSDHNPVGDCMSKYHGPARVCVSDVAQFSENA